MGENDDYGFNLRQRFLLTLVSLPACLIKPSGLEALLIHCPVFDSNSCFLRHKMQTQMTCSKTQEETEAKTIFSCHLSLNDLSGHKIFSKTQINLSFASRAIKRNLNRKGKNVVDSQRKCSMKS